MATISNHVLERYQYGAHIRKGRQLYMLSEKKIYFGDWLVGDNQPPIIIIEMNRQISDREAPFYLEVNGHENIIRTFGSVENSLNLTILVQEYAPQGDLADCLMDNQFHFTQVILLPMFEQIADAMSYVASKKIVHGDLGCRNVLVFQVDPNHPRNSLVKLTDFGLSRWIDRPPANEDKTIVPIRYCAPEILRNNQHTSYSEKSDVFSMGVLIWEALSNSEIPYASIDEDNDVIQKKLNNEMLLQPKDSDRQFWVLMNNCWHRKPEERPTFDEIRERLSDMKISELPYDLITDPSHKRQLHCAFELDIDIKITRLLNNSDPSMEIYGAKWITREEEEEGSIVLIGRKEEPSEHEQLIFSTFKKHRNIIRTHGFVGNDRGSVMILQERAPYGNLRSLLESGQFQPSATVLVEIFSQIINAMIAIVDQGLIHGDLRCENIFVFEMHPTDPKRNLVKLANFTLAHRNDPLDSNNRRVNVPVRYCALEILRSAGRSNYSELSDVYSMGVLMWQAYSRGKRPYDSSETNGEVRQRKMKGEKLTRPLLCHQLVWAIMEDCWHNEPKLRFKFHEMKIRFTNIGQTSIEPYPYELNKDIRQRGSLNGRFYEADWIPKRDPSINLLVLDEATAEHQASLYLQFKEHPHIIQTYGLVKNDQQLVMLLQERAVHGDLQTLLQNGTFQPSAQVLVEIFLQIVDAMIYITEKDVVHGDLRCANIHVFQMDPTQPRVNAVKLTNFSLARRKNQSFTEYKLPDSQVQYSAPEIFRSVDGSNYSELSDVYSMGMLMYEGCSKGAVPYGRGMSDNDIREQKLRNQNLTKPKGCHRQIWSIIESCCFNEPSLRLTFKELQTQLSKVNIKPIPLVLCYSCNSSFPENEIEDHRASCIQPMTPIDKPIIGFPGHLNEGYVKGDEEDYTKLYSSKPPRPKRPSSTESDRPLRTKPKLDTSYPRSIPSSSCNYCDAHVLNGEMDKHLKTCSVRKHFSVIELEPKTSNETCNNCRRQFPSNQIANHRTTCKPVVPTTVTRQPDRFTASSNLRPINRPRVEERTPSPPPPQSFWARLCPCLRH